MKSSVKNYLAITKTEWNGLVVLVLLILGVLAAPYVYQHFHKDKVLNFKKFNTALTQLKKAGVTGNSISEEDDLNKPLTQVKLFKFNPNKLPVLQWQMLGLSAAQIKGIKNYEAKGGRFYTKADVKKMYTLTPQNYKRLEPYINLPLNNNYNTELTLIIELNTADTTALTRLKGIGPAFARRIVQYRERLGGFHSKQQLKEVFGIDDMLYHDIKSQLTVNPRKVVKMNVNAVELDDLKNFPYLNYKQANALIQYRKQHGDYEAVNELLNIVIIDETVLRKVKPYFIVK